MSTPTAHPSSQALRAKVLKRFRLLRDERDREARLVWAGMLALHFTPQEADILRSAGYLSPSDEELLHLITRNR